MSTLDSHHLLSDEGHDEEIEVEDREGRENQYIEEDRATAGSVAFWNGLTSGRYRHIMAATILGLGLLSVVLLLVFGLIPRYGAHITEDGDIDAESQAMWGQPLMSSEDLQQLANLTKAAMSGRGVSAAATVDPCVDFYSYACGGWLEDHPVSRIPSDRSSWSRSFSEIDQRNEQLLLEILTDGWPLVGTLFKNCMDQTTRDTLSYTPIASLLDEIEALTNLPDLFTALGHIHASGAPGFFDVWVDADLKNPDYNILNIDQGGFLLGSRDYYEGDDPVFASLREQYRNHSFRTFLLLEGQNASTALEASRVSYEIEASLAHRSALDTEREDLNDIYHKASFATLLNLQDPALPAELNTTQLWQNYFMAVSGQSSSPFSLQTQVICFNPGFFHNLTLFMAQTPLHQLKIYLKWMVLYTFSEYLSTPFVQEASYWRQALYGSAAPPQYRTCKAVVNNVLGQLVGRYFVNKVFSEKSKTLAFDLVSRIIQVFNQTIGASTWITTENTKAGAEAKMNMLTKLIGYPDHWPNYDQTVIEPGLFLQGILAKNRADTQDSFSQIGQLHDRLAWLMNPQTVNAYYNPEANEIVFPAAILQPPFFNASWPAAMNFGGIGMVMGHEIGHSTDNEGSQFDASGALNDWWDPDSRAKFANRTRCVRDLYSSFQVPGFDPALYLDGELTLGENIADISGLQFSYAAFQQLSKHTDQADDLIEKTFGMTNDQLFFVSFAQTWCTSYRPQYLHWLVTSNPHSPAQFRVNGAVSQHPSFAKAFHCSTSSPLGKPTCPVW